MRAVEIVAAGHESPERMRAPRCRNALPSCQWGPLTFLVPRCFQWNEVRRKLKVQKKLQRPNPNESLDALAP